MLEKQKSPNLATGICQRTFENKECLTTGTTIIYELKTLYLLENEARLTLDSYNKPVERTGGIWLLGRSTSQGRKAPSKCTKSNLAL